MAMRGYEPVEGDDSLARITSEHGSALQIGTYGESARVRLLHVRDGRVEIELADVADDEPPDTGIGRLLSAELSKGRTAIGKAR